LVNLLIGIFELYDRNLLAYSPAYAGGWAFFYKKYILIAINIAIDFITSFKYKLDKKG
jgi:hypothetical protein